MLFDNKEIERIAGAHVKNKNAFIACSKLRGKPAEIVLSGDSREMIKATVGIIQREAKLLDVKYEEIVGLLGEIKEGTGIVVKEGMKMPEELSEEDEKELEEYKAKARKECDRIVAEKEAEITALVKELAGKDVMIGQLKGKIVNQDQERQKEKKELNKVIRRLEADIRRMEKCIKNMRGDKNENVQAC